jgi:hypothetical protein
MKRDYSKEKKVQEKPIVLRSLDKQKEKLLVSRGVPAQDLLFDKRIKIDVAESLIKIEQHMERMPVKAISVAKQYKALRSLIEKPLVKPYTLGIGGYPSDQRAKYLAIYLMSLAVDQYNGQKKTGKALPLWHRVYGGYADSLRDKPLQEMPCMLIISNINDTSSTMKLEKVRDLLEKFSDIPRIVVSGGEPPCNTFAQKLRYPMKIGLFLGPDSYIRNE